MLSFILTVLSIWKLVVPLYLKGFDPIIVGGIFTVLLSVMIVSLVYGFDRRTLATSLGITAGVLVTAVSGIIFTDAFKIHGAVMSCSESFLYCGYQDPDLTKIFMASIFIGSSGAVMDPAVDITSTFMRWHGKSPTLPVRAYKIGNECGTGCNGNDNNHPSSCLFGKAVLRCLWFLWRRERRPITF